MLTLRANAVIRLLLNPAIIQGEGGDGNAMTGRLTRVRRAAVTSGLLHPLSLSHRRWGLHHLLSGGRGRSTGGSGGNDGGGLPFHIIEGTVLTGGVRLTVRSNELTGTWRSLEVSRGDLGREKGQLLQPTVSSLLQQAIKHPLDVGLIPTGTLGDLLSELLPVAIEVEA